MVCWVCCSDCIKCLYCCLCCICCSMSECIKEKWRKRRLHQEERMLRHEQKDCQNLIEIMATLKCTTCCGAFLIEDERYPFMTSVVKNSFELYRFAVNVLLQTVVHHGGLTCSATFIDTIFGDTHYPKITENASETILRILTISVGSCTLLEYMVKRDTFELNIKDSGIADHMCKTHGLFERENLPTHSLLALIFGVLYNEHRMFLTICAGNGILETLLYYSLKKGNMYLAKTILNFVSVIDRARVFFHEDYCIDGTRRTESIFHELIAEQTTDVAAVELMLESLSNIGEHREWILQMNDNGATALHNASGEVALYLIAKYDLSREVLGLISKNNQSVFENLVRKIKDDALLTLIKPIASDELLTLLNLGSHSTEPCDSRLMYAIANRNHFMLLAYLFQTFSYSRTVLFKLLNGCIDHIKTKWCSSGEHSDCEILLGLWYETLLDGPAFAADEEVDRKSYQKQIQAELPNFSQDDLMRLSGHSEEYIIPNNTNLRTHAFVLPNLTNREGSEDEANMASHALRAIGANVYCHAWDDFKDLKNTLERKLDEVRDQCCLLFICIMAHGFGGHVQGSYEGSHGKINELFDLVWRIMPDYIPTVYILQVCQKIQLTANQQPAELSPPDKSEHPILPSIPEGNTQTDARRAFADDEKARNIAKSDLIINSRPHTVVLHSTVADGYAVRGHYIDALAYELRNSDGKTDIQTMHTKAANEVLSRQRDMGTDRQTPKIESTTTKLFRIPRANHYSWRGSSADVRVDFKKISDRRPTKAQTFKYTRNNKVAPTPGDSSQDEST